jgi:quercetin dioxygenase-like cupin family protein
MNFMKIAEGVNVGPLMCELLCQPNLWGKNPCRLSKRGPHYETTDIFLRGKDETENHKTGDWSNFSDPHIPEWYKASDYLPSARPIIFDLMRRFESGMLGGVYVYKVEPGQKIHPHIDKGWHPAFYDKFNVCLQSNPEAAFCYEGERLVQKAGDVHWFRNDVNHWVVNEGQNDHIVMIVCLRLDNGYRVPFSPKGWTMDKFLDERDAKCQQVG